MDQGDSRRSAGYRIPLEIYKYALKSDSTKTPLKDIQFYLNPTATAAITPNSIDLGKTSETGYLHKQLPENVNRVTIIW
ncbi:MAG: hypothetical protein V8S36_00425 [Lachnospiraceae bacterium]